MPLGPRVGGLPLYCRAFVLYELWIFFSLHVNLRGLYVALYYIIYLVFVTYLSTKLVVVFSIPRYWQHVAQCSENSGSIFWHHVLSSIKVLMPCLNGNIEAYVLCFCQNCPHPLFDSMFFWRKIYKDLFSLSIPEWSSWPFILGTVISRKPVYM